MKIFETSKKILNKIISDGMPFAVALKVVFKNDNVDQSLKGNIAALVGCELRHHLVFDNLMSNYFPNVEFEKTIYVRFFAANQLFLKRFVKNEILELAYADVDKNDLNKFVDFISTNNEIIPDVLDKTGPEFLSYRFNTPAWVIKMWQKQFGKGLTFKMLKTNYHQSNVSLRVDTNKIGVDQLIQNHPELIKTDVSDIVFYQGKGNPKIFNEYQEEKIFFLKAGTKFVLDKLAIKPYEKMVLYCDMPNNIYLDLVARLENELNLDLITNHAQNYFETKKTIEKFSIKGIDLYNTSAANIITCVSNPVDLVICLPNSSSLDLLRNTPDYFLRCKQDKLDSILEEQTIALKECANLLNENGTLVYMVPTLNKKESMHMIGMFLANNQEFKLEEERQLFPFENLDSCLYYAILRKTGEEND